MLKLTSKHASELLGQAMSNHELTEIREHAITTPKKNVLTLVFGFERYV
jgi:hypothetical protein